VLTEEFDSAASKLAGEYDERTIPRLRTAHPASRETETERTGKTETERTGHESWFEAVQMKLANKRYTEEVVHLEGSYVVFKLFDGFTGFLRLHNEVLTVGIRTSAVSKDIKNSSSLLVSRFPLLTCRAEENNLLCTCKIYIQEIAHNEAEQIADCTIEQLENDAKELLLLCALFDFPEPGQVPEAHFPIRFSYLIPSEEAYDQLQDMFPLLRAHENSSALIYPDSVSQLRLFFTIPSDYIPLAAALQSNREAALRALSVLEPLLSLYDFEAPGLAFFLSPEDGVRIVTLGCRQREGTRWNMAECVLGLVQSLEGPRNWRLDADTAVLLDYEPVLVSIQEICRQANWNSSLSHPHILASPGVISLVDGRYDLLRPSGLISLENLLNDSPLPTEILTIMLIIGETLVFLHSHGLCHLSLSPKSVYLRDRKTLAVAITPPAVLPCWLSPTDYIDPFTALDLREGHPSPSCDVYSFAQLLNFCWDPHLLAASQHNETTSKALCRLVHRAMQNRGRPSLFELLEALIRIV